MLTPCHAAPALRPQVWPLPRRPRPRAQGSAHLRGRWALLGPAGLCRACSAGSAAACPYSACGCCHPRRSGTPLPPWLAPSLQAARPPRMRWGGWRRAACCSQSQAPRCMKAWWWGSTAGRRVGARAGQARAVRGWGRHGRGLLRFPAPQSTLPADQSHFSLSTTRQSINHRESDLEVNPVREKKLTNVRASGADDKVYLAPPRAMTLEDAIGWVGGWGCGGGGGREEGCRWQGRLESGPRVAMAARRACIACAVLALPPKLPTPACPHPTMPTTPTPQICGGRRVDRGDALQAAPAQAHAGVRHAAAAEAQGGGDGVMPPGLSRRRPLT